MISDLPTKFKTLENKIKRQKVALSKINNNYDELQLVLATNSLAAPPLPIMTKTNKKIDRPIYCRDKKKGDCYEKCNVVCSFTIEQLESQTKSLSSSEVNIELQKHNHPITRKINNKWRTSKEAIQELLNHYNYSHPM